MAALQLAINPFIATENVVQSLTFRAAQLLLADGTSNKILWLYLPLCQGQTLLLYSP